jgi:hypothetical protein
MAQEQAHEVVSDGGARAALTCAGLVLVATGVVARFGWPAAAIVVGGLLLWLGRSR